MPGPAGIVEAGAIGFGGQSVIIIRHTHIARNYHFGLFYLGIGRNAPNKNRQEEEFVLHCFVFAGCMYSGLKIRNFFSGQLIIAKQITKFNRTSVQIAPYLKLPLGEVGYGDLSLGGMGALLSIKRDL